MKADYHERNVVNSQFHIFKSNDKLATLTGSVNLSVSYWLMYLLPRYYMSLKHQTVGVCFHWRSFTNLQILCLDSSSSSFSPSAQHHQQWSPAASLCHSPHLCQHNPESQVPVINWKNTNKNRNSGALGIYCTLKCSQKPSSVIFQSKHCPTWSLWQHLQFTGGWFHFSSSQYSSLMGSHREHCSKIQALNVCV